MTQMIDALVPDLPESIADATLLEWHKRPGERVSASDNLVDLETDKVVLEVPAPSDGILREILVQTGDTVTAGTRLARIEPLSEVPSSETAPTPDRLDTPDSAPPLAPAARRLIRELDLDARHIPGSGRDGRIHKADVMAWLDQQENSAPATDPDRPAWRTPEPPTPQTRVVSDARPQRRVPMTRLRARIAERLLESQHQSATLTTFNDVDMGAVMALRQRYRDSFEQRHGTRLGIMSFFVKAVVAALREHPMLNAAIDGQDILYQDYFDIGIAVSTERGLVVPILRDCDRLSLAEIESNISAFAQRARDGTLSVEELTGGTFSITNGGVFGSLLSTPILNPPQSAILGLHKIEERPIAIDGQVVIRPMMYLALSYDHRLIDGRDAVRFLVGIKNTIEDPARLLLDL